MTDETANQTPEADADELRTEFLHSIETREGRFFVTLVHGDNVAEFSVLPGAGPEKFEAIVSSFTGEDTPETVKQAWKLRQACRELDVFNDEFRAQGDVA